MGTSGVEPTTAGEVFVSYSRRNFFFTESLARQLDTWPGIKIWWDAQQLKPGDDWDREIAGALERAGSLVLVASRASLASAHVEREWRAAQLDGKPIHVVFADPVTLPPDLEPVSTHDLRSHFEEGAYALGTAICLPGGGRRTVVRRVGGIRAPGVVWGLGLALAALALVSLGEAATAFTEVLGPDSRAVVRRLSTSDGLANGGIGFLLCVQLVASAAGCVLLARRRFSRSMLALGPFLGAAGVALTWQLELADWGSDDFPGPWGFLLAAVTVANVGASWRALVSVDVPRWLPAWEPVVKGGVSPQPQSGGSTRTFAVHHDAVCDQMVGGAVRDVLSEYGHVPSEAEAELHLLIVSADTREAWLGERLQSLGSSAVCVFATGVRLPAALPELQRRQWVDYRDLSARTLEALAATLARHAVDWSILPQNIERSRLPFGIRAVFGAMVLVAGPAIGAGIGGLLAPRGFGDLPLIPVLGSGSADDPLFTGMAPLMFGTGVGLATIATLVRWRRLTMRGFSVAFAVLFLLVLYMGGPPIAASLVVFWELPAHTRNFDVWITVPLLAWAFTDSESARRLWLPATRDQRQRGRTLGRPRHSPLWLLYLMVSAAFWALAVQSWPTEPA